MSEPCAFDGCTRKAVSRSPWCRTHLRRRASGEFTAPVRPYGRRPEESVKNAAIDYADAQDEERAWNKLRTAAARWFKSKGWKPPPRHV
jgi:hypothetical protein